MKNAQKVLRLSIALAACLPLFVCPADAQRQTKRSDPNTYYRAPNTMSGKMIILPIGTTFEGRLNITVSSAKSHAGQSFSIVLAAPVLANGVDVIIPAGSEVCGEVVEAISAKSQPKIKGGPLPHGKLRVQITTLRTPDGTAFPLVGNLVGEEEGKNGKGRSRMQSPLGSGVGYVGTSEAFEAVAPGANRYGKQYNQGRGPDYVKKREFLAHEIYGTGGDQRGQIEDRRVRSLVVRKNDLWIDAGSPLTVKLQAPLRLSITPNNAGVPVGNAEPEQQEDLPQPSQRGAGSEIPPISSQDNSAGQMDAAPAQPRRRPDPVPSQAAPQQAQPSPGASPSSDF